MKKILVPIDFSPCSLNALEIAKAIASKSGNEILLLNVLDYSAHVTSVFDSGVNEALLVDVFAKLKLDSDTKMSEIINKNKSLISLSAKTEVGLPRDVILSLIESGDIELVIMGTKGTDGIAEVFVGSNTERIVRDSKVPVLSVGASVKGFDLKTIVFASDFEEKTGEKFDDLVWIASLFDAEIKLVRINTPSSFKNTLAAEKTMIDFVSKHGIEKYTIEQFNYEEFEAGLNHYSKRVGADMIAIGTHGRTGLSYFYHGGSKAEDVVNHFDMPVFTFRIS